MYGLYCFRDNDRSSLNCASMLKGGWWWRSCGRGLNGLYLTNQNDYIGRQGELSTIRFSNGILLLFGTFLNSAYPKYSK